MKNVIYLILSSIIVNSCNRNPAEPISSETITETKITKENSVTENQSPSGDELEKYNFKSGALINGKSVDSTVGLMKNNFREGEWKYYSDSTLMMMIFYKDGVDIFSVVNGDTVYSNKE